MHSSLTAVMPDCIVNSTKNDQYNETLMLSLQINDNLYIVVFAVFYN